MKKLRSVALATILSLALAANVFAGPFDGVLTLFNAAVSSAVLFLSASPDNGDSCPLRICQECQPACRPPESR